MAAELPVSQVLMKDKEPMKEMKKTKVAGWSTEKMDEKASKQECKDAEEMVQWRSINQEEIGNVENTVGKLRKQCQRSTKWRLAREHTQEEVSRRSGGWSRESKNINLENGVKTAGRESFRASGNTSCSESKACRRAGRKRRRCGCSKG